MVTINYLYEREKRIARPSRGVGGDETLTRRGRDPSVGQASLYGLAPLPTRERGSLPLARKDGAIDRARSDASARRENYFDSGAVYWNRDNVRSRGSPRDEILTRTGPPRYIPASAARE